MNHTSPAIRLKVGGTSSPDIKKPVKGHKNLRKGRNSETGNYYFITTCCYNKKQLLVEKEIFQVLYDSFMWFGQSLYIDPIFIVAMPDHVHLIFQLCGQKSLSDIMRGYKEYTGRKIKQKINLTTSVWQNQFYDHGIRKDESLVEIMKYCWYNPVRAGIVETPEKYPYWWSKYDMLDSRLETAPTGDNSRLETAPTGDNSRLETAPTKKENKK